MTSIINVPDPTSGVQLSALGVNLGTNVALSLFTLGAFCWLRPKNGVVYAKKFQTSAEEKRAPQLGEGYFAWMRPVWECSDRELVSKIGLDAVVFIRFLRMCRQVAMAMAVFGLGALIPINVIATLREPPGTTKNAVTANPLNLLTLGGIVTNLDWLWAHVGATWVYSLILMFAMWHGYRTFLKYRIEYFESEAFQENIASRTIMVAGLPASLQGDDKLMQFVLNMGFQERPVQAHVGRKVDKLPELLEKQKKMVTGLEKVMAKHYSDPSKPPSKRPTVSMGGFCGAKVDAIDYYSQQIEQLTEQIEATRNSINNSSPTNYGFVSYATIQDANSVAKALANPLVLRQRSKMIDPPDVMLSPVPKDIVWFNVANPRQLRKSRRVIVNSLFVVGSFLFFIPMGLLATFAKLDTFVGFVPSTKPYFDANPFVAGMCQSLFPVIVMDILFMIVRKLIVYLAFLQGNITKSSTDRSTLAKFYLFFTVNNLIVMAFASTLLEFFSKFKFFLSTVTFSAQDWTALKALIGQSSGILPALANNVIGTSIFWVNYMSLRNFSALLDLTQIVTLFSHWARSSLTARENKELDKPPVFDYPSYYSAHLFLLTVAMVYAPVAPLVLFFAVVYFSLSSLTVKYQLMYVFRTKVETGGRLFRVVYNRLFVVLILAQVLMIGVLNLKTGHKQSLAVLPLPILSVLFKLFLSRHYDPKIDFYDYGSAKNELHLRHKNHSASAEAHRLSSSFENPAMQAKMFVAMVPEGAKKLLGSKILNMGAGKSTKKPSKAERLQNQQRESWDKAQQQIQHAGQMQQQYPLQPGYQVKMTSGEYQRPKNLNQQSFEMGHIGSKGKNQKFQLLNDPLDDGHHQGGHGADELLDDYYDDQRQALTQKPAPFDNYGNTSVKSNSSAPSRAGATSPPVYGQQDMTSFIAGRYRAEGATGTYNTGYGQQQQQQTGPAKPNYMELAKMHQTDSYKTTGKATQYEDAALAKLNNIKIGKKNHHHNQQQGGVSNSTSHDTMVNNMDDPFSAPAHTIAPSTGVMTSTVDVTGDYYSHQPTQQQSQTEYRTASPSHGSSRMPAGSPAPRMPRNSPPRRMATEQGLQTSSSSPNLAGRYAQGGSNNNDQYTQGHQHSHSTSGSGYDLPGPLHRSQTAAPSLNTNQSYLQQQQQQYGKDEYSSPVQSPPSRRGQQQYQQQQQYDNYQY